MHQLRIAPAACALATLLALTPIAIGQGNGRGNGGGGGGGGTSELYSPVLHLLGDRHDVQPWNLSFLELADWATKPERQPEQVQPDGSGREIVFAISSRGDLSVRQPDGTGTRPRAPRTRCSSDRVSTTWTSSSPCHRS